MRGVSVTGQKRLPTSDQPIAWLTVQIDFGEVPISIRGEQGFDPDVLERATLQVALRKSDIAGEDDAAVDKAAIHRAQRLIRIAEKLLSSGPL